MFTFGKRIDQAFQLI